MAWNILDSFLRCYYNIIISYFIPVPLKFHLFPVLDVLFFCNFSLVHEISEWRLRAERFAEGRTKKIQLWKLWKHEK